MNFFLIIPTCKQAVDFKKRAQLDKRQKVCFLSATPLNENIRTPFL